MGIVNMQGEEISSGAEDVESSVEQPAAAAIAITGLLVTALCSDGVFREVKLTTPQSNKVVSFIQSKCGGKLTLKPAPLQILQMQKVRKVAPKRWWQRAWNSLTSPPGPNRS